MNFVRRGFISAVVAGAIAPRLFAATVILQPVADSTLIEIFPDNNMGATLFVNAGTAGSEGLRNRGLFLFDFTSIPANSKIKSAAVTLEVTKEPAANGEASSFALHRLLKPWGEGEKNSTDEFSPGLGLAATTNEATWNARFAFTTNTWTSPGASNDYATAVSSSTMVYGVAEFPQFNSTPQMIADVQGWVNNPATNFGWLLKSESESTPRTARRFGSREWAAGDTNSAPYVEVQFVPPPEITEMQIANGQFRFSFLAELNQDYRIEFRDTLASSNSWLTLSNFPAPPVTTNILVSETLATNARFYRIVLP